jgi:type VI secretion system protein ImpC
LSADIMESDKMPDTEAAPVPDGGPAEVIAGLLDDIVGEHDARAGQTRQASLRVWVDRLRQQILEGHPAILDQVEAVVASRVAEIDELLTAQVNEILHAEPFQRLEASWRGLHYLVSNCDTSSMLKIRVLNASKDDLRRDLEGAVEFDMSVLFHRVYEEEYGTLGGEPYAALIGDYEFSNHPEDVALLERFGNVAAAAHAPLITGASPKLFGWDSFEELVTPRDLSKIFATAEYVKWRAFRESEDSRYVGLTLPRILLREPYDPETLPVATFCFREDVSGQHRGNYLWGNAAYAFGVSLARAFARYSWCALIRGVDGGGLVDNLPSVSFGTGEGPLAPKAPTEVSVSDVREKELADLGLLPLVHRKATAAAAFYSTQSCQRPKQYDRDDASASARLSAQLQYILCTSRFAHYLKVMMRDKTGRMMSAGECQDYLLRWLTDYCVANPESLGMEGRARKPLRDARVEVRERRGKPGHYEAVIHLQPHFLLDELSVSLRLVTELPRPVLAG